jgi:hypothetical protein
MAEIDVACESSATRLLPARRETKSIFGPFVDISVPYATHHPFPHFCPFLFPSRDYGFSHLIACPFPIDADNRLIYPRATPAE